MIKQTRALNLTLAAGVAVTVLAGTGNAMAAGADHDRLREVMHRLTTVDGGPGALIQIHDRRGDRVLTSGVADVTSREPVRGDSGFRIGSMTKPFVATVMLQLVAERRVVLDAPVERYLPGVVRGPGGDNDGRMITVRQLLQHTSGIPDYLRFLKPQDILKDPLAHHDARDLVNLALAQPETFKPGGGWSYSNTGYLLAGMIIEKVTGRTYDKEISRRIVKPLKLRRTYVPVDSPAIPGPHPRGYARPGRDAPLLDVTSINPSVAGASGSMVSTGPDLNRFLGALLRGELLRPAQLREMMRTQPTKPKDPTKPEDPSTSRAYGLGLESYELPCGGLYWGHSGDMFGFETLGGATVNGRQASVMVNLDPGGTDAQSDDMRTAVETALC